MEKTRIEKHINVVNSVTKLEELMLRHTIPDEMVGDTILIDAKKMMEFIQNMKDKVTDNFSVELNKRGKAYEPLKNAINTMNDERKRNTDESETDDDHREADMGTPIKQAPFGGIVVDKD